MEQTHQEFVAGLTRLLAAREGCGIMVLIDGPTGLEIMCTSTNFAYEFGLLDVARLTIGTVPLRKVRNSPVPRA